MFNNPFRDAVIIIVAVIAISAVTGLAFKASGALLFLIFTFYGTFKKLSDDRKKREKNAELMAEVYKRMSE